MRISINQMVMSNFGDCFPKFTCPILIELSAIRRNHVLDFNQINSDPETNKKCYFRVSSVDTVDSKIFA